MDMGFWIPGRAIAKSACRAPNSWVFSNHSQKLQPFLKKHWPIQLMEQIKTSTVAAIPLLNWLVSTKGRNKNEQILRYLRECSHIWQWFSPIPRERADDLHSYLVSNGSKVSKIKGGIPPRERGKWIMNQVKKFDFWDNVKDWSLQRGLILLLAMLSNDAGPRDLSFFVHRVGRVQDVMACQEQPSNSLTN